MKALVTGASGFLGHAVCDRLSESGHGAIALVRRGGSAPPGTLEVQGDLSDTSRLARTLDDQRPDAVIHLAAEIASQRSESKIRETNVEGTRRLIDACRAAGEPRFLFASTVVTGDAKGALLDEQSKLPVETSYGRSKQEGERLVRESGLDAVVIRPSHVYGRGGWYESELVKAIKGPGHFAVIGSGKNLWDVVRVEDVASAFVRAMEKAPGGSLFHVVDDEPLTQYEFVAKTANALGISKPRKVPAFVARMAIGSDPAKAVTRSARSSNERIKREIGWEPEFPNADAGVPDAVAAIENRV